MITNISSNINAGGDLATISGVNTNIVGSNITSLGNAAITTGADLNILSAQDTSYKYSASWKKGNSTFGANSKSSSSTSSTTTNVASNINVGGDLNIGSQDNINIAASNLNSDQNINLIAKNEVNIESGQNTIQSQSASSKKGGTARSSSKDTDVRINNVASNLGATDNININSGSDTNIIASNLSGTNGNIIVGKYTDQNINSPTFNQEIINKDATLTIKAGEDLHYNYHQDMKIKTDSTAVVVGVVAAVAVTVATAGVGAVTAPMIIGAAAGGAATGAQGKKGKTTTTETTEINQVASNLNFTGDLNTQSSGDTVIKASNISADNATILTGKFRDQTTGVENVVNVDSKLKLESAFDSVKTHTTVEKVKPNYVGIAVVAGGTALVSAGINNAFANTQFVGVGATGPVQTNLVVPSIIPTVGSKAAMPMLGSFVAGNLASEALGKIISPNIKSEKKNSDFRQTEIKTNLNFNNLFTE